MSRLTRFWTLMKAPHLVWWLQRSSLEVLSTEVKNSDHALTLLEEWFTKPMGKRTRLRNKIMSNSFIWFRIPKTDWWFIIRIFTAQTTKKFFNLVRSLKVRMCNLENYLTDKLMINAANNTFRAFFFVSIGLLTDWLFKAHKEKLLREASSLEQLSLIILNTWWNKM